MSTGTQELTPQEPAPSEPQRILNTFFAPSKTFTDIRRNASWWAPWLLMAVMSYGLTYTVGAKVGWDQVNDNQLRMSPRRAAQVENLPPDQRQRQMAIAAMVTKYIAFAFPVFILVGVAVIALILMATFNFGAGAHLTFKHSMAVVMYAHLPGIVKSLLAIVSLMAGASPEGFTFQNPVATNLAGLFTVGTPLYTLGAAFDIITIWVLIIESIGFSIISGLKRGTSFAIVFGWYAFITLIGVGFSALMS